MHNIIAMNMCIEQAHLELQHICYLLRKKQKEIDWIFGWGDDL